MSTSSYNYSHLFPPAKTPNYLWLPSGDSNLSKLGNHLLATFLKMMKLRSMCGTTCGTMCGTQYGTQCGIVWYGVVQSVVCLPDRTDVNNPVVEVL